MIKKNAVAIGLLSLSILSTELFWTRLFSAEFYYTFAFLILSLAVLGLGLGALCSKLFRRFRNPQLLPVWLLLTGAIIVVAVPAVFALHLDFSKLVSEPINIVKLIGAIMLLGAGFVFGGMSIAQIFRSGSNEISRLYMWDFFGASLGVIVFIAVMNAFGAPATAVYCALPALLASFLTAERWGKLVPVAALAVAAGYYIHIKEIPEQKREERAPVVYKHWDATAKIKIYQRDPETRGINIDNIANTPVYAFDGKWPEADSLKVRFDIDVRNLIRKFERCRFLSLGAGGGSDVLQALQYNCTEVHAVEVIPHINEMMTRGYLRDFSGNIYNDKRVTVVTEDARAYIRRFENKFDVIYSLSSNSWAAFASGSFALAENYLFTTEAFMDYWHALSDSGYLSIEHQFYMPRLVAETVDALERLGVRDPHAHFAVYDLTALHRKLLLVSKRPLDAQTIGDAYANSDPGIVKTTKRLYPPQEDNRENIMNAIVLSGWRSVADTARIDISPCTDDRPFIAQLGLLRNVTPATLDKIPLYEFTGFPLSRIIVLIILGVSIIGIIPLNLVPYFMKGEKLRGVPWLYFFTIGIGYMMIEVVLIQQYTLFIGSSIYSFALVLTTLLIFSGIGSRRSAHHSALFIFPAIALWLLADIFIFRYLFYLFGGWTLLPRMLVSFVFLAPIGYFMGMPFPKGASSMPHLVDWAFAVNGSASVIGSVAIVLIASSYGYSIALGTGMAVYLLAFGLYAGGLMDAQGVDSQPVGEEMREAVG